MWQQGPAPVSPFDRRFRAGAFLALAAVVLSFAGVFLDFFKATGDINGASANVGGLDEYGVGWWPLLYVLIGAGALMLPLLAPKAAVAGAVIGAGFGGVEMLYVVYRFADASSAGNDLSVSISPRAGFFALVLGGLLLVGGGVAHLIASRQPAAGARAGGAVQPGTAPYGQPQGWAPAPQQPPYPYGQYAPQQYPPPPPPPASYPPPPPGSYPPPPPRPASYPPQQYPPQQYPAPPAAGPASPPGKPGQAA